MFWRILFPLLTIPLAFSAEWKESLPVSAVLAVLHADGKTEAVRTMASMTPDSSIALGGSSRLENGRITINSIDNIDVIGLARSEIHSRVLMTPEVKMVYHIDVGLKRIDKLKDDTVRCEFILVMSDTNLGILCAHAIIDLQKRTDGDIYSNLVVDLENSYAFMK